MSLETEIVKLVEAIGGDIGSILAAQQAEKDALVVIYRDADFAYAYRFPNDGEEAE